MVSLPPLLHPGAGRAMKIHHPITARILALELPVEVAVTLQMVIVFGELRTVAAVLLPLLRKLLTAPNVATLPQVRPLHRETQMYMEPTRTP